MRQRYPITNAYIPNAYTLSGNPYDLVGIPDTAAPTAEQIAADPLAAIRRLGAVSSPNHGGGGLRRDATLSGINAWPESQAKKDALAMFHNPTNRSVNVDSKSTWRDNDTGWHANPNLSGFQTKFGETEVYGTDARNNLTRVRMQQPGGHKYDLMDVFYREDPVTRDLVMVGEPQKFKQQSSNSKYGQEAGKVAAAALAIYGGPAIAGALGGGALGAAGAGAVIGGATPALTGGDSTQIARGALTGGVIAPVAAAAGNFAGQAASGYGTAAQAAASGLARGFTGAALGGAASGNFDLERSLYGGLSGGVGAGVADLSGGGDFGRFAGSLAGGTVAGLGRGNDFGDSLQGALRTAATNALRSQINQGARGALSSLASDQQSGAQSGAGQVAQQSTPGVEWPVQNPEPVGSTQTDYFRSNFGGDPAQRGASMYDDYDGPGGSYLSNFDFSEDGSAMPSFGGSDDYGLGSFSQNMPDLFGYGGGAYAPSFDQDQIGFGGYNGVPTPSGFLGTSPEPSNPPPYTPAFGWSGMGPDTNVGTPSWALPAGETPSPSFMGDTPWWSPDAPGANFGQAPEPGFLSQVGAWLKGSGGLGKLISGAVRGGATGGVGGAVAGAVGGGSQQGGGGADSYMNMLGVIGLLSSLQQSRRGADAHSPAQLRAMLPQNSPMSEAQTAANTQLMSAPLTKYQAPNSADSLRRYGVDVNSPGYAEGGGVSPLSRISQDLEAYMHEGPGHVADGDGGGQDDLVDARLSPGEYVFDADVVSALGDGNNDEGARRLDAMRVALRDHKRGAPSDRIPPKAKSPLAYLAMAMKE